MFLINIIDEREVNENVKDKAASDYIVIGYLFYIIHLLNSVWILISS